MRERFRRKGLEGFADHEVLELLLYYGNRRMDVNPLAHQLMDTFGSLKGVLEAQAEQLQAVPGVGEETATLLSLMLPLFRRYAELQGRERIVLANRAEAERYCLALLTGLRSECCYVLSLGADLRLLGSRMVAEGSLDQVLAPPRRVVETALNQNAQGVIVCHNHPGGTLAPSEADIRWTEQIQQALSSVEITLLDHIIVSEGKTYSMVQHGELLQAEER